MIQFLIHCVHTHTCILKQRIIEKCKFNIAEAIVIMLKHNNRVFLPSKRCGN